MSAKQKKKRNKPYTGIDARMQRPTVTRVSAEELNAFQEWWRTYGKLTKFILTVVGIVLLLGLLVIGFIGIIAL